MSDWLALLLPFAAYALALVASGSAPPARPRRAHFDPILPTPKRARLRLVPGALGSPKALFECEWGALAFQQRTSQPRILAEELDSPS